VEEALLDRHERAQGVRLACQVTVREPLSIEIPADILGVRRWTCRVRSNRNVATLMKELVLELPEGEALDFRAGAYVSLTCPPHRTPFSSFTIEPPFDTEWERLDLRRLVAHCEQSETRAYSIASPPGEGGQLRLLVRIATPPAGAHSSVPPGAVSSWVFALQPGDPVDVAGPYGNFRASESEREMILVGGGAGMAPLRSIILDQLLRVQTTRAISYWYGARNLRELLYREEFDELAAEHGNFRWCAALSEPLPEDEWSGEEGFIHAVLLRSYLDAHPAPEECEYYLCGPPLMVQAVLRMLDGLGVQRDMIRFDDFGS
jgi:Na+-transporting NADH:ubiquinone oxidoreductase subunit F